MVAEAGPLALSCGGDTRRHEKKHLSLKQHKHLQREHHTQTLSLCFDSLQLYLSVRLW